MDRCVCGHGKEQHFVCDEHPDVDIRGKLNKALKELAKDPMNLPNSMALFGEPSAKELKNWAHDVKADEIDLVFEYLRDKSCLNKKGERLAHEFWEKYIKC